MTTIAAPASPLSVGSVAQLTLSLAAIVALIFAVSWVVKRLKLGTLRSRGEPARHAQRKAQVDSKRKPNPRSEERTGERVQND